MLMMGLMPTSRETSTLRFHPARSFHSSEMRASRMPLAAMRSMNRRYMHNGLNSKVLTRPAMTRSGVSVMCCAISRTRSHGSSLSSRTHFFRCDPEISSMASNPARSICSATESIMPVVMFSAHRLWCPSRRVVSTKVMSLLIASAMPAPDLIAGGG